MYMFQLEAIHLHLKRIGNMYISGGTRPSVSQPSGQAGHSQVFKSTVQIIARCGSTGQGHICLAENRPRYLSFSQWHQLYHWLLMAPIHHDTNAFTNVFFFAWSSGQTGSTQQSRALRVTGLPTPPPSLLLVSSIHQSHPDVTLPLCLWERMMQKIKNCWHFFFLLITSGYWSLHPEYDRKQCGEAGAGQDPVACITTGEY